MNPRSAAPLRRKNLQPRRFRPEKVQQQAWPPQIATARAQRLQAVTRRQTLLDLHQLALRCRRVFLGAATAVRSRPAERVVCQCAAK